MDTDRMSVKEALSKSSFESLLDNHYEFQKVFREVITALNKHISENRGDITIQFNQFMGAHTETVGLQCTASSGNAETVKGLIKAWGFGHFIDTDADSVDGESPYKFVLQLRFDEIDQLMAAGSERAEPSPEDWLKALFEYGKDAEEQKGDAANTTRKVVEEVLSSLVAELGVTLEVKDAYYDKGLIVISGVKIVEKPGDKDSQVTLGQVGEGLREHGFTRIQSSFGSGPSVLFGSVPVNKFIEVAKKGQIDFVVAHIRGLLEKVYA